MSMRCRFCGQVVFPKGVPPDPLPIVLAKADLVTGSFARALHLQADGRTYAGTAGSTIYPISVLVEEIDWTRTARAPEWEEYWRDPARRQQFGLPAVSGGEGV